MVREGGQEEGQPAGWPAATSCSSLEAYRVSTQCSMCGSNAGSGTGDACGRGQSWSQRHPPQQTRANPHFTGGNRPLKTGSD